MAGANARFEDAIAALNRDDLEEARAILEKLVVADATHHEAWHQLGLIHYRRQRFQEATEAIERAVAEGAQTARVFRNLGTALQRANRPDDALDAYGEALARDPSLVAAHSNRAAIFTKRFEYEAAESHLEQVLEIDPNHANTWNNLGVLYRDTLRLREAVEAFRGAIERDPGDSVAHSNLLLTLNYLPDITAAELFAAHEAFGEHLSDRGSESTPRYREDAPLRVGYVSGDLRRHSVAFFIEPVLAAHDRARFHVTCYSNGEGTDVVTERLRSLSDAWHDITHRTDDEVAAMIARDEIDLLVDLSGHSSRNRLPLFARRAAPVQATWLGYPNTTGIAAMDYRISDAIADPDGAEAVHTERLVRLDGGFHCYLPVEGAPPVTPLPVSQGQPFTFGSFNNLLKVTDDVLRCWASILLAVPDSRLWLKAYQLTGEAAREHVRSVLDEAGVSEERVVLDGWAAGMDDHLAQYAQVDLALDPFPYHGTTTTLEALWMGVPTLTLRGDRHASRVGASLMTQVGHETFVAETVEEYIHKATAIAADHQGLEELRAGLRGDLMASGLCDARRFTAELERAYDAMVGRPAGPSRTVHTLVDGAKIVTPARRDLLTAFVLAEQGDWFEDELRFLRQWAQPGATILDIGANYGTFSMSLARAVGPGGRVIAVEPTPATAACFRASVEANGFDHVELVEAALSDREGTLHLRLETDSELNALVEHPAEGIETVAVKSHTLDNLLEGRDVEALDFVKLDAEGAEAMIIEGAERTLSRFSPLVLFEIKHGDTLNVELTEVFISRGFLLYILVPGLQVLEPYDPERELDAFQLNILACRPDRAASLEERGLLVTAREAAPAIESSPLLGGWLATLPYAPAFASRWAGAGRRPGALRYLEALDRYATAHRGAHLSAACRLAHLDEAITGAQEAIGLSGTAGRKHTLARMLRDRGRRLASVELVGELAREALAGDIELDEPFFLADPDFETIDPGGQLGNWCLAAAVSARIKGASFSTYFSRGPTKRSLETLEGMGLLSAAMKRRLSLLR